MVPGKHREKEPFKKRSVNMNKYPSSFLILWSPLPPVSYNDRDAEGRQKDSPQMKAITIFSDHMIENKQALRHKSQHPMFDTLAASNTRTNNLHII